MRNYETKIQEIKIQVLAQVAQLTWEDRLHNSAALLDIPEKIIPGPTAQLRCCIYKERAIISSRMKLAMGGDGSHPNIVEMLPIACDECPVKEINVGPACRGCLATRCLHACPKDAITMVNHRATIDHSKCISCGKCVAACQYSAIIKIQRPCEKSCPAGAISMGEDKKAVIDDGKCISCGTCVNQCPFGAIQDRSWITDAIRILQEGKRRGVPVHAIIAPSIAGQFAPATYGQVVAGIRKLGFDEVTEVALGADRVAVLEGDELLEKGALTSSCCPSYVEYLSKKHPDLAHLLSQAPSPMVYLARHIKEKSPEAKVVFIGPCIAKKREFQLGRTGGAVDCALTYEELLALFLSRDIEPADEPEELLEQASAFGRGFAYSGGVTKAVGRALEEKQATEFTFLPVPCSGIAACEVALQKYKHGVLKENFIEGMACDGGCVQGAGCLIRSPKNRLDVQQHAKLAEGRAILPTPEPREEIDRPLAAALEERP